MIKNYISVGFISLSLLFVIGFGSSANAASLTGSQVSAIVALLESFGADSETVSDVRAALGASSHSLSCNAFTGLSYGDVDTRSDNRVSQLQTWLGMSSVTPGFGTYGPKTQALWNSKCGGAEETGSTSNIVSIEPISVPTISYASGKGGFGSGDSNTIYGKGFSTIEEVYLVGDSDTKITLDHTTSSDFQVDVIVPDLSRAVYDVYVVNEVGASKPYSLGYLGSGSAAPPLISSVSGKGGFGPGDSNTIYGQNFSTTEEAYLINDSDTKIDLTYTLVADTQLSVVIPSVSGDTYSLYVENKWGTSEPYSAAW